MQTSEISYSEYQERHSSSVRQVCRLGDYELLRSIGAGGFWLFVVGTPEQAVTACEYRDAFERQHEIEMIKRASAGKEVTVVRDSQAPGWSDSPDSFTPPDAPTPPSVPAANVVPNSGTR